MFGVIKKFILIHSIFVFGMVGQNSWAQDAYWVTFTDKGDISSYTPSDLLSEKALENREKLDIPIDFQDYPVNRAYIKALSMRGIQIKNRSRWFNAVSAYVGEEDILGLLALPFVSDIRPVAGGQRTAEWEGILPHVAIEADSLPYLGTYRNQLNMIGVDSLHALGFRGEGVTIAVFDNGYLGVDTVSAFQHLFDNNQILATRDFVDADDDVYEGCIHCRHGTQVLSTLAAVVPDRIRGSAPGATYILMRTENDASETPQEEDNWVAAAEFADSLGAQVFSTSLGYLDFFDDPRDNHSREDLDGNTTVITRAADLAAAKGIIVVNSAGNEAGKGMAAPADGDSVIAVGAVDGRKIRASFSSFGYTVDERVKPDVMAVGAGTYLVNFNGMITQGNGTSFSCPILSGMLACILQAHPGTGYGDLYQALIQSADRFNEPNEFYGYGIPSAMGMHSLLGGASTVSTRNLIEKGHWQLYPNPGSGTFFLTTLHPSKFQRISLEISDLHGRRHYSNELITPMNGEKIPIRTNLSPGFYVYTLKEYQEDVYIDSGKLIVEE